MKEFRSWITDTKTINNPTGSWQNARNILMTKGFKSIANEHSNELKYLVQGTIIGSIETNSDVVFFSINQDGTSEIGVINLETLNPIYQTKIRTSLFNFKKENPIEGIFIYNFKGELIISFCDGTSITSNSPKLVNLDNLDVGINF